MESDIEFSGRRDQVTASNDGKIQDFGFCYFFFFFQALCLTRNVRILQSQKFTLQDEVIYHQVNSIVLEITATLLFTSITIFCGFWGSFSRNSSMLPTYLFIFVTYGLAAYRAQPQKSSCITFQPRYANLLSSKITQHDIKIQKGWKYHKNIFQRKSY